MIKERLVRLQACFSIVAWVDGFAILVAVFVVAMVGSVNDYKKEE